MNEKPGLIKILQSNSDQLNSQKALVGLDAFIDEIIKVVEVRKSREEVKYFDTIADFSRFTMGQAGKSAGIEVDRRARLLGGNGPLMARALHKAGVNTTCITAAGYPVLDEVFQPLAKEINLVSIGNSAFTYAFEFDDGKLMMNCNGPLMDLSWDGIKKILPPQQFAELISNAGLFALVDWCNILQIQSIWRGILSEVMPLVKNNTGKSRKFFFDLADPSKRTQEEVVEALGLIDQFKPYGEVILGLNKNEAQRVSKALIHIYKLNLSPNYDNMELLGRLIFDSMHIDAVIIHPLDCAYAVTKNGVIMRPGKIVEKPVITTGGGDNFNAGFCAGWLLDLPLEDCLSTGIALSGAYVSSGHSPSMQEILEYLE